MSGQIDYYPLFPLGIVLLPGERIPLHIFEQRYRTMIGECLEKGTTFGLICLTDAGLAQVGCTARVSELTEELDDGRMNIQVDGEQPFRLMSRIDELEYPAGVIELLDDEPGEAAPELIAVARERYADLVDKVTGERPDADDLAAMDPYAMAATIDFDVEAKQRLLELRSETDRCTTLTSLLITAIERVEYAETAAERAQTNGHAPH